MANPKFKNYPFSVFGYLIDMIVNIFTRPQAVSKWFIKINNLIIIFKIRSHLRFESAGDQFPFCGDIETFFVFGGLHPSYESLGYMQLERASGKKGEVGKFKVEKSDLRLGRMKLEND